MRSHTFRSRIQATIDIKVIQDLNEFMTKKNIGISGAVEFLLKSALNGNEDLEIRLLEQEQKMNMLGYKLGRQIEKLRNENQELRRELDGSDRNNSRADDNNDLYNNGNDVSDLGEEAKEGDRIQEMEPEDRDQSKEGNEGDPEKGRGKKFDRSKLKWA